MRVPVIIELSEREDKFVRALCIHGLKPTRAATMSGYAVSTARHLLRKPHLREAVRAVHANAAAIVARLDKQEIADATK